MRLPVGDMDDMSDPGATIMRYLKKKSPGQVRFYCKEASFNQRRLFFGQGYPHAAMSPNQPLGINIMAKLIKRGCAKTGMNISGHGLRHIFVSTLVNDPGVSVEESLAASCHASMSAQRPYMMRNHHSEAAKFNALGLFSHDSDENDKEN